MYFLFNADLSKFDSQYYDTGRERLIQTRLIWSST